MQGRKIFRKSMPKETADPQVQGFYLDSPGIVPAGFFEIRTPGVLLGALYTYPGFGYLIPYPPRFYPLAGRSEWEFTDYRKLSLILTGTKIRAAAMGPFSDCSVRGVPKA
jgi:hypothetical protein